jgi:UDP-2,3-diacylglucosamine pyrophosphatase LpxH
MADEQENIKINFNTNAKQAASDTNALGASIEHTTDATNENTNAVKQQDATYKTFKTQLREANAELQKQIQLTGESSQETIKAAKAVAELKDQMGFAKDLADNFNPDQKMKSLGAATQIAGTGLQGLTAGMALFGSESEDTQKQLLKVQAAMAFSDAISQMSNLGDQWKLLKATISSSTLATKANTAATGAAAMIQNLFTGSVNASGAGFKALKFAIAATGIGLLVVGLGLVVANFESIKKVVMKVVPGLSAVGDTIMNIVNAVTDFIGVTSEADRALDRLKANAKASTALNEKFLAEHGDQLDEFTKQKIEARNRYNAEVEKDGANQIALAQRLNRELAKIEYSRGDESRKIAKENAEKAKKAKEEADKKAREEAEKKAKEDAEALANFKATVAQNELDLNAQKLQENRDNLQRQNDEIAKSEEDKSAIEEKSAEETKRRNEVIFQQEEAIQNAKLNLANQAVNLFSQIFGKSKKAQKASLLASNAVGLAEVVINTQKAVSADLAVPFGAGLPKVPIDIASGALGAASIVAATAKGLKELGGGSSGSAPSFGSLSGGNINSSPSVAFSNTAENQIGQSVAKTQSDQPPIKVFVNESDITDSQKNVKVLVNENSF